MRKRIVIVGGKGNGTNLAGAIDGVTQDGWRWEVAGFLNESHQRGDTIDGFPVLGGPSDAVGLAGDGTFIVFSILAAEAGETRAGKIDALGIPDDVLATVVHPSAVVASSAHLEPGAVVMPFVFVGANARVGRHAFIHGQSYIARDARLHDFAYMSPQSYVGAECEAERGAYLGIAAHVRERVTLGTWSVVGMGANCLEDVAPYTVVVGNPARPLRRVEAQK